MWAVAGSTPGPPPAYVYVASLAAARRVAERESMGARSRGRCAGCLHAPLYLVVEVRLISQVVRGQWLVLQGSVFKPLSGLSALRLCEL